MALSLVRRQRDRLAYAVRAYWKGPYTLSSILARALSDGPSSSAGVTVTEQTALTYSAFWACVNAISTDVASYPLIHYKRLKAGGKERFDDSKVYRIVHDEPNPEMTSFTMRQIMTAHVLTWGNAYAEIERDVLGRPKFLWPITPDRVTPNRNRVGDIVYEVRNSTATPDMIPAMNMLHIPGLGFDGLMGYSVARMAQESIGLGLATERFGGTFFGNGATFGGVIAYKGPKPPEQSKKNLEEVLEAKHQGVNRAHKLLALYNDATYTRLGIPPNDAQFIESRQFQIEETCRWFRMPPHKIQHLLRSTNNNIEHQGIEYYVDTTRPWCVRWEQECNRKLIAVPERRIQFFEHMIEGSLRGDIQSRYGAYAVGRQWGWLSADDIRERENMNPLPNGSGQIYLVPLNMTPADRIGDVIDAQIKAKETPAPAAPAAEPPANDEGDRAIEAIRSEMVAAQARAEAHLTRAVQAEEALVGAHASVVASSVLQTERDEARAAHRQAVQDVAVQQALLLEATQRADRVQAERDAADAFAKEAVARHAETSRHHVEAVEARERADVARRQAESDAAAALALVADRDESLVVAQEMLGEKDGWVPPAGAIEALEALAALRAEMQAREVVLAEVQGHLDAARATLTDREAALHDAQIRIEEREVWVPPADLAGVMADLVPLRDSCQTLTAERDAALAAVEQAEQRVAVETAARTAVEDVLAAERAEFVRMQAFHMAETSEADMRGLATAVERDTARTTAVLAEERAAAEATARAGVEAALEAERVRFTGELGETSAKLDQVKADLEAKAAEVDAERQAAAQATAQAAAEAQARAVLAASLETERQRVTAVIGAHRGLIADAMGRMIRRETEKARRAQVTPEKLRAWIDTFYPVHEDICRAALLPAIRAHLAWKQSEEDPSAVTDAFVKQHIAESQRQLRMVLESDGEDIPQTLETTLRRWELERADELADRILRDEVTHIAR